jgi:serine/threonine-protein kinase RsbT
MVVPRGERQMSRPDGPAPRPEARVLRSETLALRTVDDLVALRYAVRGGSIEQGFSLLDQTKMVTATSELGRNALVYGGGGSAQLDLLVDLAQHASRKGLRVVVRDQGPGIADVEQALTNGFSTGTGLGLGLGGAKRLVDLFEIQTAPGRGTRVTITMWTHDHAAAPTPAR